jgi:hypothetical protein
MSAVSAYQNNIEYAGLRFFAYDINDILVTNRHQSANVAQAIADLDKTINASPDIATSSSDSLVLYRGCTFQNRNPEKSDNIALFRQYLSTSIQLAEALLFARRCESDFGEVHVLKIIYPRNKPHIILRENSENEVLLPRNCSFAVADWELTENEKLESSLCSSLQTRPALKCLTHHCSGSL